MSSDVLLISMPWASLNHPSIQLGILKRVLQENEIQTEVRSYNLSLMEHFAAASTNSETPITIREYVAVGVDFCTLGLGEWIFSIPPFREISDNVDDSYLNYLRHQRVPEPVISTARQMRDLVPGFTDSCVEDVLRAAPRIIGFTTGFNQAVPALTLSKKLKQLNPSISIIFGGSDCDGPMGSAMLRAFPWIDVVIRGEGETALVEIARSLLTGSKIKPHQGACYRKGNRIVISERPVENRIVINDLPTPDYDEYFSRLESSPLRADIFPNVELAFESSRGCWWGEKHHCTFCGINGLSMSFRSKTPDRLMAELKELASRYRSVNFMATDAILDMQYFQTVLPQLRDSGIDFHIFYETKANLKKEQLYLLRDAGVFQIQPGIESLSTPILKQMRKGVSALQNLRLLKWAREIRIDVLWNIIYGFPGESAEAYEQMAKLVDDISHFQPPTLVPLVLDRFSPYFNNPDTFGLRITGPPTFFRYVFPREPSVTELFRDLAYRFEYEYMNPQRPELYIGPLRDKIEEWQEIARLDRSHLSYHHGPDFLTITDRRKHMRPIQYTLEGIDGKIYLSCDAGASFESIVREFAQPDSGPLTPADVKSLLDELTMLHLLYEEDGQYLSLATAEYPDRRRDKQRA